MKNAVLWLGPQISLYQMGLEATDSDKLFVLFPPSLFRQIHGILLRTEDMIIFDFKNKMCLKVIK
jgi:hypothetical protein